MARSLYDPNTFSAGVSAGVAMRNADTFEQNAEANRQQIPSENAQRMAHANLYNIQSEEAQIALNQKQQYDRAASLYSTTKGNPNAYEQALNDNNIPLGIGLKVHEDVQKAREMDPTVKARKQAISNAAIMAVTAPTDAEFEATKMSLYQRAVSQGMDLSEYGIKSEDDVKRMTRADMAGFVMDPKVIEEFGKQRMQMLEGVSGLTAEQKLIRQSLAEKLKVPINKITATQILDEEQKRKQDLKVSMSQYNLSPEEHDALNRAIMNGLDPYRINSRTAKIYANQEIQHPGMKWNDLAAQAIYERSTATSNVKALLGAIDPLLNKLDEAGKALGNMKSPAANRAVNWWKENVTGNPELTAFKNLRDDTIAEVERGLLNTGVLSDSKYNRAIRNVSEAANYEQLKQAIKNVRIVVRTRLESTASGPYPNATQKTETKPSESIKVGNFTVKVKQ